MRSRVSCALALIVAGAACAVPSRDNPRDSANAPSARIVVVEIPATAECTEASEAQAVEVIHASRGACLALDATSSDDPQGDALVDFDFIARQGTAATMSLGSNATGFFVLSDELRRELLDPGSVAFGVEVKDRSGAYGDAETLFTLENSAPVAVTDPPRLLDRDVPWSSESCHPVTFDATSTLDPDGDPPAQLHYTWTFSAEPLDDCANGAPPDAATVTRLVKFDIDQRLLVTLSVGDGDAQSEPATTYVDVRVANPWFESPYDANTFIRLDSSFEYLDGTGTGRADVNVAAVSPDLLAIAWESTNGGAAFLGMISPADPATLLYGPVPAPDDAFVYGNPAGTASSVWTFDYIGTGTLRRYDLSGAVGAEITYVPPPEASLGDIPLVVVDPTGNAWMSSVGATSLVRVDAVTGAGVELLSDPARVITGLAARPGTNEVWALEGSNPDAGDGAASTLVRFGPASELARYPLELGGFRAGAGWLDSNRLWIGIPGGVQLLDATRLPDGIDAAIIREVALDADPGVLYVDPATKTCWATAFNGLDTTYEISEDGFVIPHVDKGFVNWQERNGRLWILAGNSYRGYSLTRTAISASAFLAAEGPPRRDSATGGFWVESSSSGSIRHYDMRGSIIESVDTARDGASGPLIGFPATEAIWTSPDGEWIWALTPGNELYRFDLSARPPIRSLVLADASAMVESGSPDEPILLVADPGAAVPFAWVANATSVATIDADGTETTRLQILPAELGGVGSFPRFIARTPATNRACVASSNGATPLHLRMIAPDAVPATPPLLDVTLAVPAGFNVLGVAATHDDVEGDRCWLFYGEPAPSVHDCTTPTPSGELRVAVYQPGSTVPVATFTDSLYGGKEFEAVTSRDVWYVSRRCDPTNSSLPIGDYVVRLNRLGTSTIRQTLFRQPN